MSASVIIRRAEVSDAEEMCAAMRTEDLQNFSFFEQEVTLGRQRAYLDKMLSSSRDMLCVILADGKMVGTCGLHEIDMDNMNARIGAMLFSREHRGKGLGSAAIRQLVAFGFRAFGLHKIYLKVFAENTVSCTKYAHLGFQFEARLRDHYLLRGRYHDMAVMSILKQDWKD